MSSSWRSSGTCGRRTRPPRTIQAYTEAVRRYAEFAAATRMPLSVRAVTREHIEAFIEDHVARLRPASAGTRYRSLQQYWRWLADDGELDEVSEFRHRDRSRA